MTIDFDYQKKVWGTAVPSCSPFSLAGLRFYYFLKNIRGIYGTLLEIGCGAGGNLQALRKYRPYLELYGVDIGRAAIEYGREHFPLLHLQIAPAEVLPFENETFDIVCYFDVLEHVRDPSACIDESYRVLKKGGVLHAYVPCEGELFSLHGILNKAGLNLKEKSAGHIQKLTKRQLIAFCESAGFAVTETAWSCHLLNQIGDIGYYLWLTLSGKKLEQSLEGSIDTKPPFIRGFLSFNKSLASAIWYWESRLLWKIPGAGLHITCRKSL